MEGELTFGVNLAPNLRYLSTIFISIMTRQWRTRGVGDGCFKSHEIRNVYSELFKTSATSEVETLVLLYTAASR